MAFKKASREKVNLRLGIAGPSGSGKTFTALEIASGLSKNGSIAVIDSEHGSSLLYANNFEFDQQDLVSFDPLEYCKKIREAAEAGYEVLIIDSLTHAWHKILEEVDQVAARKFKGNTWSAWSDITPRLYRPLINAILTYPGHLIATFRSKTQTVMETDDKGKNQIKKMGMKVEQKENIEYEFTIFMEMSNDGNVAYISKDRTGLLYGKYIPRPNRQTGLMIRNDLESGSEPVRVRTYDELPPPPTQSLDYGQKQESGQKPEPAEKKKSVIEAVSEKVEEAVSRLDINHLNTVTRPGIEKLFSEKRMTEDAYKKCEKIIDDGVSKIAEIIMKRDQSPVESPKIANPNLDSNGKALEVLF